MNENIPPINTSSTPASSNKNTYLITITIIVLVFTGLYFINRGLINSYIEKNQNKNLEENNSLTWKKYEDARYGFQFKYSPNYNESVRDDRHMPQFYTQNKVSFYVIPNFLTDDNKVVANVAEKFQGLEKKRIGNFEWGIDRSRGVSYDLGGYSIVYSIKEDGLMVSFASTRPLNDNELDQFEKIVETFSLINLPYERVDKAIKNLKIGDTESVFTVIKIEPNNEQYGISGDNALVSYQGEIKLTGKIIIPDSNETNFCVSLDKESESKLPLLDKSSNVDQLCFDSKTPLSRDIENAEQVSITIKDLSVSYDSKGIGLHAKLVNIIKSD